MVALLDVNVLIALAWPTHVHPRVVAKVVIGQTKSRCSLKAWDRASFVPPSSAPGLLVIVGAVARQRLAEQGFRFLVAAHQPHQAAQVAGALGHHRVVRTQVRPAQREMRSAVKRQGREARSGHLTEDVVSSPP